MATAITDTTVMPTPMPTMDTTARGLLMLRLPLLLRPMLMLTMVSTDMDTDMAWPTTAMDMDTLPTTDTTVMPIPMPTTDSTARGLLMPLPLLMLTMVLMAMVLPTMAMDMDTSPTTVMPTMDTTDIPTPTDTTDIINLLIFVKN